MAEDHDKEVMASRGKVHHGNNDGYVPHHPEPGRGENPKASQKVRLWAHAQGEGCYDTSAQGDRTCFGETDKFHAPAQNSSVHIGKGEPHNFRYSGSQRSGHLRMSGAAGAHRIGHRK